MRDKQKAASRRSWRTKKAAFNEAQYSVVKVLGRLRCPYTYHRTGLGFVNDKVYEVVMCLALGADDIYYPIQVTG